MEYSCVQLNDLPDEILITIFKKLANIEVLYSLVSVNKRLNKIAHDFVFTNNLALLWSTSDGFVYSLHDPILDRFCLHILPKIHQKIKWLELESQSMERILLATNYPNLYGISLYNMQAETAIGLFTEETSVLRTLKNQILSLTIDISTTGTQHRPADVHRIIFTHIFTMFTNLQYLNFGLYSIRDQRLSIRTPLLTVISANLLELHVSLDNFQDCLYLLDGRFNKLHTLCADIFFIRSSRQCHIYSYPYKLKHYDDITNNFPGGIFKCVRKVSLFDERPFEHEFFLQIAQSFPFMEKLYVTNQKQQINKRFRKSKNENQNLSIIKYPHLKYLHLVNACKDYHEQFLLDTKTCLPLDVGVYMNYKLVKKLTRNFRRNTTRSNCAKLNYVYLHRKVEFPGYSNSFFSTKTQLPEH
ncbi:unnamed protein product, partial [Rotaria sp. Silwood2]